MKESNLVNGAAEDESTNSRVAVLLVGLSIVSAALGYITSILAARLLGIERFEHYAVAVASLSLMASLAEAGVGKYALKVQPEYILHEQFALAAGYWRFALGTTLLVSLGLAACLTIIEGLEDFDFGAYPAGVAILFLPAIALAGVGVDFVMANRAPITGSLIARLVTPGASVLLLVSAGFAMERVSTNVAVICYCAGSVASLLMCAIAYYCTSPRPVLTSAPEYRIRQWIPNCLSFAGIAFLTSYLFKISILVLELISVPKREVAYFAAALETGCLILLVSKSTDKMFQPDMSIIIQLRDVSRGQRLRRRRYGLVGTGCVLFYVGILCLGKPILDLYGPGFRQGYPALCYIAFGACVATMFSLAPSYLRFIGLGTFVKLLLIIGGATLAALTVGFGNLYGSVGAGFAFCLVLSSVFIGFALKAGHEFSRLHCAPNNESSEQP